MYTFTALFFLHFAHELQFEGKKIDQSYEHSFELLFFFYSLSHFLISLDFLHNYYLCS